MSDKKEKLRKKIIARRHELTPDYRESRSEALVDKLIDLEPVNTAERVMLYWPSGGEISPLGLMKAAGCSSKQYIFPRVEGNKLGLYEIQDPRSQLVRGTYELLEPDPARCSRLEARHVDLIITPGIAFDRRCYRLGRGGGYYDRLLSRVPKGYSIGVGYQFQLLEQIPFKEHDQPVDRVIVA